MNAQQVPPPADAEKPRNRIRLNWKSRWVTGLAGLVVGLLLGLSVSLLPAQVAGPPEPSVGPSVRTFPPTAPPADVPASVPTPTPLPSEIPTGLTLLEVDFEGAEKGEVDSESFTELFGDVHTFDDDEFENLEIESGDGNRFLRSHNPADEYGGVNLQVELPREVDEAVLRYRMRFSEDFDFDRGGKLPGLAGVAPGSDLGAASGGGSPDGDDAWSARGMWYSDEAYSNYGPGEAVQYLYYPEMPGDYGENLEYDVTYPRGEWVDVATHVVMNTPDEEDGSITVYVDGREVVKREDMRFRDVDELAIDRIFFATYRGGSEPEWQSDQDGWIDFDDIEVILPR